jgi:hypothetical protein
MKTYTITCVGCGCEGIAEAASPLGEATLGWTNYMDISNGLTFASLCGSCQKKVEPALKTLLHVFGKRAGHIHLAHILNKMWKSQDVKGTSDES